MLIHLSSFLSIYKQQPLDESENQLQVEIRFMYLVLNIENFQQR